MNEHKKIHLPSPSYWPITLAFGLVLMVSGVVSSIWVSLVGLVVLLVALAGWTFENRAEGKEGKHD